MFESKSSVYGSSDISIRRYQMICCAYLYCGVKPTIGGVTAGPVSNQHLDELILLAPVDVRHVLRVLVQTHREQALLKGSQIGSVGRVWKHKLGNGFFLLTSVSRPHFLLTSTLEPLSATIRDVNYRCCGWERNRIV